jgi:F-type H+/Na+-transporting ATPase subunit alpha
MLDERLDNKINIVNEIIEQIDLYRDTIKKEEVGIVLDSGDGIARIGGLPGAFMREILDFGNNVFGVVFNLEREQLVAIILDRHNKVKEGHAVRKTNRIIEVPVGKDFLGRVVDSLGNPMDGLSDIHAKAFRPLAATPPAIIHRKPVTKPFHTGCMVVDSMVPIGHGQRELIIGDRQTGKTTIALDAIINQKGKDVICVYVAIGQKNSSVAKIKKLLEDNEAMEYTVIINAPASSPSALQYYAPYSGCAMAEHFMYQGKRTLVVYDDLTKHAHAYRNISLLLKRPPGREAYPGDIFFIHSRLLERSAQLNDDIGGGSMTALPIVETESGDVSAYIPTNIISITDGQIFLSSDFFNSNIRPAINPGISVSRVGGVAQIKAMRKVASLLRVTLAQYREKEKFSLFASDLDDVTALQIKRGKIMIEVLKQKEHNNLKDIDQVIILYAGINGFFDDVPLDKLHLIQENVIFYFIEYDEKFYKKIDESKDLLEEDFKTMDLILPKIIKDIFI